MESLKQEIHKNELAFPSVFDANSKSLNMVTSGDKTLPRAMPEMKSSNSAEHQDPPNEAQQLQISNHQEKPAIVISHDEISPRPTTDHLVSSGPDTDNIAKKGAGSRLEILLDVDKRSKSPRVAGSSPLRRQKSSSDGSNVQKQQQQTGTNNPKSGSNSGVKSAFTKPSPHKTSSREGNGNDSQTNSMSDAEPIKSSGDMIYKLLEVNLRDQLEKTYLQYMKTSTEKSESANHKTSSGSVKNGLKNGTNYEVSNLNLFASLLQPKDLFSTLQASANHVSPNIKPKKDSKTTKIGRAKVQKKKPQGITYKSPAKNIQQSQAFSHPNGITREHKKKEDVSPGLQMLIGALQEQNMLRRSSEDEFGNLHNLRIQEEAHSLHESRKFKKNSNETAPVPYKDIDLTTNETLECLKPHQHSKTSQYQRPTSEGGSGAHGSNGKAKKTCQNIFCFSNTSEMRDKIAKDTSDEHKLFKRKFNEKSYTWLCKSCVEAYDNGQYCDFCKQIYTDDNTNAIIDGQEWIECDYCDKWVHTQCEASHGVKDIVKLLDKDGYQFACLGCRSGGAKGKKSSKGKKKGRVLGKRKARSEGSGGDDKGDEDANYFGDCYEYSGYWPKYNNSSRKRRSSEMVDDKKNEKNASANSSVSGSGSKSHSIRGKDDVLDDIKKITELINEENLSKKNSIGEELKEQMNAKSPSEAVKSEEKENDSNISDESNKNAKMKDVEKAPSIENQKEEDKEDEEDDEGEEEDEEEEKKKKDATPSNSIRRMSTRQKESKKEKPVVAPVAKPPLKRAPSNIQPPSKAIKKVVAKPAVIDQKNGNKSYQTRQQVQQKTAAKPTKKK